MILYLLCLLVKYPITITPGRTGQKGPVLEKNALNRLVHNLLELISKGYNPTDLAPKSHSIDGLSMVHNCS
jgi:hypothetical protein